MTKNQLKLNQQDKLDLSIHTEFQESLLTKAKKIRRKAPRVAVTKPHLDLIVAWASEEISLKQFCHAVEVNSDGKALTYIATIFKESWLSEWIVKPPELLEEK